MQQIRSIQLGIFLNVELFFPFFGFIFFMSVVPLCTIQFQSTLYTETNFCVTLRLESEQRLSGIVFSKLAKLYEVMNQRIFCLYLHFCFVIAQRNKVSRHRTEAGLVKSPSLASSVTAISILSGGLLCFIFPAT
jgi:hypothetical protein